MNSATNPALSSLSSLVGLKVRASCELLADLQADGETLEGLDLRGTITAVANRNGQIWLDTATGSFTPAELSADYASAAPASLGGCWRDHSLETLLGAL